MRTVSVLIVIWWAALSPAAGKACSDDTVSLRGDWGQAEFFVELAATPETRARGLMGRRSLDRFAGMLFVYERPVHARFWMKNTHIPLDMLFFDRHGVMTALHENAEPESLAVIDGGADVLFVLEINGGMAARLAITPGSEMRHPLLGPGAAWPCVP